MISSERGMLVSSRPAWDSVSLASNPSTATQIHASRNKAPASQPMRMDACHDVYCDTTPPTTRPSKAAHPTRTPARTLRECSDMACINVIGAS